MMKKMNKKGFTLMEMLIVVAIIAILIAIAIPTFSGALDKSKRSADEANIRAAYAEAMVEYMSEGEGEATTAVLQSSSGKEITVKTTDGTKTMASQGKEVTVTVNSDGEVSYSGLSELSSKSSD